MDGKHRCFGNLSGQELYAHYHDHEWGMPSHDDRHLFEMLILEGAQAGLSWETILKRREAYRQAFYHFDPLSVSQMSDEQLEALLLPRMHASSDQMEPPGIIRNRLKVFSARKNARVFLDIQKQWGTFDRYLWSFVKGAPIINHWEDLKQIPTKTPQSIALSCDLKKRGMIFVGPTIMYAFMQAVGMVNDHVKGCWRFPNRHAIVGD